MIDWVAKKTDKDVKKDVDKVDEIVHDNNMTISDAIKKYIKKIGDDYENWTLGSRSLLSDDNIAKRIRENSVVEFKNGLDYKKGSKYIINTDKDKKFKYGDILKAASWNAPARNFARGNVFGEYKTRWTGAI